MTKRDRASNMLKTLAQFVMLMVIYINVTPIEDGSRQGSIAVMAALVIYMMGVMVSVPTNGEK